MSEDLEKVEGFEDLPNERWRKIIGCAHYDVSDKCRIRSWSNRGHGTGRAKIPKVLVGGTDQDGYQIYLIYTDPKTRKTIKRSNLVAFAFLGPRPPGFYVCHNDGNPQNDLPENLEYKSPQDNSDDMVYKHKTSAWGEKCSRSKLTEAQAKEIYISTETIKELSLKFKIQPSNIKKIKEGKTWKQATENLKVN